MSAGTADAVDAGGSAATSRPFVFVREHGDRAGEINDFYNGFMGLERPFEAYQWEFQNGPGGPALVWSIIETASDRVVGHHSIIRTPMVCRGLGIAGGRTENTIIAPAVRTKIFYPGMEKRALAETLKELGIIYTIHSRGPGRLRERLGYKPVGRWTVYLPRIGAGYLEALLHRVRDRLPMKLPEGAVAPLARAAAGVGGLIGRRKPPRSIEIAELRDVNDIAGEYEMFWQRARQAYDLTIDRSLEFLRWRVGDNPHLSFRTWSVRRDGRLLAVVIGHRHRIGRASALYIDDIITGGYDDASFEVAVAVLPELDPQAESVVLTTLAVDTPLHRVLRRRFPWQARALDRFGEKLFDELLALDTTTGHKRPWYVTAIFTEGMDTSRDAA
jgi:hypothetical protein